MFKENYRPPLEQFEFAGIWCPLDYVLPLTLKQTLEMREQQTTAKNGWHSFETEIP